MGMGLAPTWLCQMSPPLLHKTTLTNVYNGYTNERNNYGRVWI